MHVQTQVQAQVQTQVQTQVRAHGRTRFSRLLAGALVAGGLLLGAGPAAATRIAYLATDLPDTGPEDLWQLEYVVSQRTFGAGFGFSILFPPEDAAGLAPVASGVEADWDVLVLQPEPLLASAGRYDAQARSDGASLLLSFVVRFFWSGAGDPGAQAFEVYDPSFAVVETGQTVPVPEPGTALLLALGVAALARRA